MNRHLLKSVQFAKTDFDKLDQMRELVEQAGFNVKYYTGIHSNFDLPYDFYRPTSDTPRTQIEIIQKDGTLYELSELSPLVASLTGTIHGNRRFYFPKVMLEHEDFRALIKNDSFLPAQK